MNEKFRGQDWLMLVLFLAAPQAAGLLGTLFTMPAIPAWYDGLVKPDFSPPNWVFGPVWTTLYLMMGIAAFLVWRKQAPATGRALGAFWIQLVLNALWSILFFGMRSPLLGLIDIVALWLAIVWTMIEFKKVSRPAFWLMVPYLLWVSFATALNLAILILN
jgi:tryptophan-rich sensory protein